MTTAPKRERCGARTTESLWHQVCDRKKGHAGMHADNSRHGSMCEWNDDPGATPHRPAERIAKRTAGFDPPSADAYTVGDAIGLQRVLATAAQPLTASEMAQAKKIAEEILAEDTPSAEAMQAAEELCDFHALTPMGECREDIARALDAFAKQAVEAERTGIAQDLVALDRAGGLKLTSAIDAIIARGNK